VTNVHPPALEPPAFAPHPWDQISALELARYDRRVPSGDERSTIGASPFREERYSPQELGNLGPRCSILHGPIEALNLPNPGPGPWPVPVG
jgi:hypothetical protein